MRKDARYGTKRRGILQKGLFSAAAGVLAPSGMAWAQAGATAKIIVPYAPGAATDQLARMMALVLDEAMGGTKYVVENRAGGGSQIGTRAVAAAAPDGLTLGFIDTAFVINPALVGDKLPYDTRRDFTPLSLTASAPFVVQVHSSIPANTLAEFVALCKSNPGKYSFGSSGQGSAPHLAGEQFRHAARIEVNHAPYRGGSTVLNDLIAGHIHFGFTTVPTMIEHIRAGTVRALAVTGNKRAVQLPNVPAFAELGLPEVDAQPIFGLIGPAQLPTPLVQRLSAAASQAVRTGPMGQRLAETGFFPIGSSAAEFRTRIDAEIDKWAAVVKAAGIKPGA